ncbi:hypothetical protein [Nocardioides xinjiangensis]|uniref:hypothetical protein n=1 Tax=Nocardioides xinjiangensis TaxID=2817376 RepID=UPI001B30B0CE|nr:hypothetical protein [Nocardioides sp. SYSU D00514]
MLRVVSPAFFDGDTLQSRAFQDQSAGVAASFGLAGPCASVNLQSVWEAHGGNVNALLEAFGPGSRIAQVAVRDLRNLVNSLDQPMPQGIMSDPRPDAPWHAVMFSLAGGNRSKGAMRAVVEVAHWFT